MASRSYSWSTKITATVGALLGWATLWIPIQTYPVIYGSDIYLINHGEPLPLMAGLVGFALLAGLTWFSPPKRWWPIATSIICLVFVILLIPALMRIEVIWDGMAPDGTLIGGIDYSSPSWGALFLILGLVAMVAASVLAWRNVNQVKRLDLTHG